MKPSILRRLLFAFLVFGLGMGAVFPFFANFFVEWKPGMFGWFVVAALAAGMSVGVINYWLVNVVLLSKLRRISEVAMAISRNDITHQCSVESHDTIGEIVTSFNKMAHNLRELIGQVAIMGGNVNQEAEVIQNVMSKVRGRFDEQYQSTKAIISSMDDLSSTVGDISQNASQVAEASRNASHLAKAGGNVVQETIRGMRQINASVSAAANAVTSLGHKSDEIGAIVAVINGIAEQTNLLALNAAIEAARAGEQGRGFAVVADEVRKLAEKTANATKEIGQMIQSIQEETRHTVLTMESGTAQVQEGTTKAEEAGGALQEIMSSVESVSNMIERIAAGAATQNQMVGGILDRVQEISTKIEETIADTVASEKASKDLAAQSAELDTALRRFKLR
jgi:methyl-accepting chemotaxis protein